MNKNEAHARIKINKMLAIFRLPSSSIDVRKNTVKKNYNEQELLASDKQLIEVFEQKLKDRIGRVWGDQWLLLKKTHLKISQSITTLM